MRTMNACLAAASLSLMLVMSANATDRLTVAVGQPGLWDSSFGEIGQKIGIFKKYDLELQLFYTSGGGETLQAVISGSANTGVSPGTLGVFGAFAKGAPIRIIAGEATGTAEYYFVKASSPIKTPKDITAANTLAYSTAGSGTFLTAQRLLKEHNVQARLVATGNVPATFTSVMSGQVDVGFSTPPFGLEAQEKGEIRIISLANDLESVRTQTVRVTIANATDLARRPDVYKRFIKAYQETIDWMYSDPKAPSMFAEYAKITPQMAQLVRDKFYPKSMLQLDKIHGIPEMMQDAIALKFIPQPLTQQQLDELLKLPGSY
jgi:NitT/TauT family transport system substrate-binding protein